jgi:hypothetical protein
MPVDSPRYQALFVFRVDRHRLQIFGFEDLPAVEALHIVDTVPTGDDGCSFMLTGCSHTGNLGYEIF